MSPEGESRRDAHSYLFTEYLKNRKVNFKGESPNRILDEVEISTEKTTVSGSVEIVLPNGSARVASLFRYIVIQGEDVDNLGGITMVPYAPKSFLSISTKTPKIYRVKVPSMPIPSANMQPVVLKLTAKPGTTARITGIAFNSQGKLSEKFDDIAYRNLGAEFPREKVELIINTQRELSLDGHIDLEREKFCRYYAAPGNVDPSFEKWAAERNFAPGRQIFKFQPALVKGYSKNQPKLEESKAKPGAARLDFFDKYKDTYNTIDEFRDIKYAMCFNDYPEFMSVKRVGRGTPLVANFDDAAKLAAAYVANQIKDRGRTANYWEVKNESTIKAEWDYHFQKQHDSWALMADLHNRVADEVHKLAPGTMVGGPSSAWMQVQVKDFGLYRNQLKFMDLTKGHVDFYSHHFYEDFGSLGAWERRQGKYSNYLLGRMESILDMFQAHMEETDNVRPILITECGSLQPGRGPSDYWLRLRSFSGYMHKLMKRPEQVELSVPFVFLSIPWNPGSGNTAFIPKDGERNNAPLEKCDATPVKNFFELWRDFDGRRLPVSFDRAFLDVTVVHSQNRIQLAVTNMGGRRLALDIKSVVGDLPIESISQRRLYYLDGEVVYEEVSPKDATAIPVDVEETTIVTVNLKSALRLSKPVNRQSWYANGTAIKTNANKGAEFKITLGGKDAKFKKTDVKKATLHVGVYREGGLGGPLAGELNGTPFTLSAAWADDMKQLFGTIKVELDPAKLSTENRIKVAGRDGLTITSVHLVAED